MVRREKGSVGKDINLNIIVFRIKWRELFNTVGGEVCSTG